MKNTNNKTICIYHSRDLDGWMSAAIVKKWFVELQFTARGNKAGYRILNINTNGITLGTTIEYSKNHNLLYMLGWDYGDDIPNLDKYDKVIMCDISFPKEEMSKLSILNYPAQEDKSFIWIDHHKSAILDNDEIVNGGSFFDGKLNDKFAACELTWQYFYPNETIPEIVRLLGRYDCFGHKGTDEEQLVLEFQYGARQAMSNYEECYILLQKEISNIVYMDNNRDNVIIRTLENGKTIYKYLCTEAKQTYSKTFPIEFIIPKEHIYIPKGSMYGGGFDIKYNFLCVNQERFNPINFGIDYHKDNYDGFACYWYKDGKWNWSLYNDNGLVDCSIIAKSLGGGGHKGAAGFVCNNEVMLNIINNNN